MFNRKKHIEQLRREESDELVGKPSKKSVVKISEKKTVIKPVEHRASTYLSRTTNTSTNRTSVHRTSITSTQSGNETSKPELTRRSKTKSLPSNKSLITLNLSKAELRTKSKTSQTVSVSSKNLNKSKQSLTNEVAKVKSKYKDHKGRSSEGFQEVQREIQKYEEGEKRKKGDTFVYPSYVQTLYMQICFLNELSCFNLGENLNYRLIVAQTDVKCLLVPRYWLLARNKGNVWNKVQSFLNKNIPTTEEVFKIFLENRRWNDYKKQLVMDIRRRSACNKINNVPYSMRLSEDIPCGVCYS